MFVQFGLNGLNYNLYFIYVFNVKNIDRSIKIEWSKSTKCMTVQVFSDWTLSESLNVGGLWDLVYYIDDTI